MGQCIGRKRGARETGSRNHRNSSSRRDCAGCCRDPASGRHARPEYPSGVVADRGRQAVQRRRPRCSAPAAQGPGQARPEEQANAVDPRGRLLACRLDRLADAQRRVELDADEARGRRLDSAYRASASAACLASAPTATSSTASGRAAAAAATASAPTPTAAPAAAGSSTSASTAASGAGDEAAGKAVPAGQAVQEQGR